MVVTSPVSACFSFPFAPAYAIAYGCRMISSVDDGLHHWFIASLFDIEHLCYGLSSPRYPLTRYVTISRAQGRVFSKLTADRVLIFDWIGDSCQANLLSTCKGLGCSKAG